MVRLLVYYFAWHYSRGLRDFMRNWTNIIWFVWHFFSIPLLARTFFSPFHKIKMKTRPGLHPDEFLQNLAVNTIMRLVGMVLRFVFIALGFILMALVMVLGGIVFAVWFLMPLVLFGLISAGIAFMVL